jgi:hypothetical protein
MRCVFFVLVAVLSVSNMSLAQVATTGSTAMGLPTTQAAVVTSPLNEPGPFSAATVPRAPDTTLAPVPLASDPAAPGTVVVCATSAATAIAPTPPPNLPASMSATSAFSSGNQISAIQAAPIVPAQAAAPASERPAATVQYLTLSARPATSFLSDYPETMIPAPPVLLPPPLPQPSINPAPIPSLLGAPSQSTSIATLGVPSPMQGSSTSFGSSIGTVSSYSPVGSPSDIACTAGTQVSNGADLPLATPEIESGYPLGSIGPDVAAPGGTSIDPDTALASASNASVAPAPNSSACLQGASTSLSPMAISPFNAAGAPTSAPLAPGC